MPQFVSTARADANGDAQCLIQGPPSGLQWIVYQVSVTSTPLRQAATATVNVNDQFLTNTAGLPDSAQGKPWIALDAAGRVTVDFTGLTSGDTAIATIGYNEVSWGSMPPGDVV